MAVSDQQERVREEGGRKKMKRTKFNGISISELGCAFVVCAPCAGPALFYDSKLTCINSGNRSLAIFSAVRVCLSVQFMREGVFCCCCSCFPSVCWEQKASFTLALAAEIPLHPTTNDLLLLIIFVAISAPVLIIIFRFVCFTTMNEGVCVFELVVGRCDCGRSHEIRENKFLKIN